jgi:hypothetical protein
MLFINLIVLTHPKKLWVERDGEHNFFSMEFTNQLRISKMELNSSQQFHCCSKLWSLKFGECGSPELEQLGRFLKPVLPHFHI